MNLFIFITETPSIFKFALKIIRTEKNTKKTILFYIKRNNSFFATNTKACYNPLA